ncbi:MAG: hypothetical protein JW748_02590 [Anaerolineales bacterium]|nr:hypothetical protein [Anaerolineales bacterium]
MRQTMRCFIILPVLALVLAGCGSGSTDENYKATRAAALTELALPTETLPIPTETVTLTPTVGNTETPPTPSATRTFTQPPAGNAPLCDNSVYISDVTIPDGTVLQPGEGFLKTWSLRNTGTCSWSTAYGLDFSSGARMDGVIAYVPQEVGPGDTIEISVGLSAPTTPGTHTGYWRLKNADGVFFGEWVSVNIVVAGSAATTAPTEILTEAAPSS